MKVESQYALLYPVMFNDDVKESIVNDSTVYYRLIRTWCQVRKIDSVRSFYFVNVFTRFRTTKEARDV